MHVSLVLHHRTAPVSFSGASPESQVRADPVRCLIGRGLEEAAPWSDKGLGTYVTPLRFSVDLLSSVTGARCRALGTHASTAARRRCGATTLGAAIVATFGGGERRDALNHHRAAAPYAAAHLHLNDVTTPSSAGMHAGNCPIGTEPPSLT